MYKKFKFIYILKMFGIEILYLCLFLFGSTFFLFFKILKIKDFLDGRIGSLK